MGMIERVCDGDQMDIPLNQRWPLKRAVRIVLECILVNKDKYSVSDRLNTS